MASRLKYFAPLGAPLAGITMFYFSHKNGFLPSIQNMTASRIVPGGERLKADMTGIHFIDETLCAFIPFFYPAVDGSAPNLSLHTANFAGAVAAIWFLIIFESIRAGNRGRLVAFSTIFGVLCQLCTFGAMMSLYVTVHLFTSPTASKPTSGNINMSLVQVKILPWSVLAGYILPSLFMVVPETSLGFLPSKQHGIAFWQPWPVYIFLFQFGLSTLSGWFCKRDKSQLVSQNRSALRYVYAFAFACAAIPHMATWSISLTALTFPTLFNPTIASTLTPGNVFANKFPWSSARPESLGFGALWLLQWDHLIGAGATLLWAMSLYGTAHSVRGIVMNRFRLCLKVIALCAVSGVAGAAVELMWERDELLLDGDDAKGVKATKSE